MTIAEIMSQPVRWSPILSECAESSGGHSTFLPGHYFQMSVSKNSGFHVPSPLVHFFCCKINLYIKGMTRGVQ